MDGGVSVCPWDEDESPEAATALSFDSVAEGYLCPIEDQDWYSFTVPAGSDLLSVSLAVDAPVTGVNPTYDIRTSDDSATIAAPESTETAQPDSSIEITHGLAPGGYYLEVRDRGNDAEDTRHPYLLSLTHRADPDANEPNNDDENAVAVSDGSVAEGYVSYRGDEDWYEISLEARDLLGITLTMAAGGIQPAYRVVDPEGSTLVANSNESGQFEDTELTYLQSIDTAGTYYVVVHDDDWMDFDYETPYTLELSVSQDPDENESNDHPNEATAMASVTCGSTWSDWQTATGYIASSGDVDWFSLPIASPSRCLVEAEVTFTNGSSLPDDLQASLRMARDSVSYTCEEDQDCSEIARACSIDLNCYWFGNNCLAQGVCAGGGACLNSGNCMVNYISGHADETIPDPSDASQDIPNPDRNTTSWTSQVWGWTEPFLFAVSDYQADSYSLTSEYTLRVRVRKDPDTTEPNSAYTYVEAGSEVQEEATIHAARAVEVEVHDCEPADGGPSDCCEAGDFVEARLSYKHDQDWFKYQHPCPGEDCMVRVIYNIDGGEVDHYVQVYADTSPWYDNIFETADTGSHAATSGHFGGIGASDYCFYAYQGHTADPYYYYLVVRDTVYVAEGQEDDGTWDWDPDQAYSFCVEKVANGCVEPPCELYTAGCGAPSSK